MNDEHFSDEEEAKITFRNIPAEDHKTFMTNRIWGGLQDGNLFELNFLLEHKPIPETVTQKMEGRNLIEVSREESGEIIRENQATVYMSLETLLSFYRWLGIKILQFRDMGIISIKDLEDKGLEDAINILDTIVPKKEEKDA